MSTTPITMRSLMQELTAESFDRDSDCYPCGPCFASSSYTIGARRLEHTQRLQVCSGVLSVIGTIGLIAITIVVLAQAKGFDSAFKISYAAAGSVTGLAFLVFLITTVQLKKFNTPLTNEQIHAFLDKEEGNTDPLIQQKIQEIRQKFPK